MKRIKNFLQDDGPKAFAAVLLITLSGSFLGTEFHHRLFSWSAGSDIQIIRFTFAVLLCLAGLGYGSHLGRSVVSHVMRFQTRRLRKIPARPRRVVTLFLSSLSETKRLNGKDVPQDGLPDHLTLSDDLEADLINLANKKRERDEQGRPQSFWSWEQPLRAIYHNVANDGPLTHIVLVCSRESIRQVHFFINNIIRRYVALKNITVQVLMRRSDDGDVIVLARDTDLMPPVYAESGWDFEDFDSLSSGLTSMLERMNQGDGGVGRINDEDITIDLTGGMKPTTVCAASVTINRRVQNQYVCTNPRILEDGRWTYDVLSYDLVLGNAGPAP